MHPPTPDEAPWRAGWRAAVALRGPALLLAAISGGVVALYYHNPAARGALEAVAAFRARHGLLFSAAASTLFAGLVPFLYLRLHPATKASHPWPHVFFFAAFWAYKGVEVDLLYQLQSALFGAAPTLATVLKKMLFDQLVYNPLFAAVYGVLIYGWKDAGFRWGPPLADLRAPRWYARRVLPVMIAVWGVWVPTVSCIYALPLALQMPLNVLVNCFWVILFSLITVRQNRA
jgi:hypothetical protein